MLSNRKVYPTVAAIVLIVTVLACGSESPPPATQAPVIIPPTAAAPAPGTETATVTHIVDGDTIDVSMGGVTYRVRYIGINTPEADEVCGDEATAANDALVSGQTVTMYRDVSETDRYDRLLRYVYIGDLFVNAELVRQGWAEATAYPPDTMYADFFETLETQAEEMGLGCHPTGIFGESVPPTGPPYFLASLITST
jgi:micrococcal nuclease